MLLSDTQLRTLAAIREYQINPEAFRVKYPELGQFFDSIQIKWEADPPQVAEAFGHITWTTSDDRND